jgi:hypothetical protein
MSKPEDGVKPGERFVVDHQGKRRVQSLYPTPDEPHGPTMHQAPSISQEECAKLLATLAAENAQLHAQCATLELSERHLLGLIEKLTARLRALRKTP